MSCDLPTVLGGGDVKVFVAKVSCRLTLRSLLTTPPACAQSTCECPVLPKQLDEYPVQPSRLAIAQLLEGARISRCRVRHTDEIAHQDCHAAQGPRQLRVARLFLRQSP